MKQRAALWLVPALLLGCGADINNASAKNAHPFTVVRTTSDSVIVRIATDSQKGPLNTQCLAIHLEPDQGYGGFNTYVATTARLPSGVCE